MWTSDAVRRLRLFPVLLTLLATGCGLADSERDERNRYIYLTFFDKTFEGFCLEHFDTNGDGRISRYEAQRVRELSCPDAGIASLADLAEFANLERLDCSGNALTELDLRACTHLSRLDCEGNALVSLDVEDLRALTWLDCSDNALERIDLTSNTSLATLDARGNRFVTLDLSTCSSVLQADVRENPQLETVYCRPSSQDVRFDGITSLVGR